MLDLVQRPDNLDRLFNRMRGESERCAVPEFSAKVLPCERVMRVTLRPLHSAGVVDLPEGLYAHHGSSADWESRGPSLLLNDDSLHQPPDVSSMYGLVGEGCQANAAIAKRRADAVLHAEFAFEARFRKRLLERHQRAPADGHPDALDIRVGRAASSDDLQRRVDRSVRRVAARVQLDADPRRDNLPWIAEPRERARVQACASRGRSQKTAIAFERRLIRCKAAIRERRRTDPVPRRQAGVKWLRHRPEVLTHTAR